MKRRMASLLLSIMLCGFGTAQSLTIYTEIDPPHQFLGTDGNLSGITIECVQEIQKRIGNRDPIQVVPWARGYAEIQTQPNIILFSMARLPERNTLFKWVGPIDERTYSFIVKTGSGIQIHSLKEAKSLGKIGVYRDDVRDIYLTKAGFTNLDRTVDNLANLKKLMDRRIDAIVASPLDVSDLAKSAGFKPEDLQELYPFFKTQLFIAFSMKTPNSTVKTWSNAFKAMKKDKTFERIYRKYYSHEPLPGPEITKF